MNTALPPAQAMAEDRLQKQGPPPPSKSLKLIYLEEEQGGYATIDGNVVSHPVGSDAVSNGAGIFIGEYFVGLADSYQSISVTPFIRY